MELVEKGATMALTLRREVPARFTGLGRVSGNRPGVYAGSGKAIQHVESPIYQRFFWGSFLDLEDLAEAEIKLVAI
jgi:hypothetical protein